MKLQLVLGINLPGIHRRADGLRLAVVADVGEVVVVLQRVEVLVGQRLEFRGVVDTVAVLVELGKDAVGRLYVGAAGAERFFEFGLGDLAVGVLPKVLLTLRIIA